MPKRSVGHYFAYTVNSKLMQPETHTHTITQSHRDTLRALVIIITLLLVKVWDDLLYLSPSVLLLLLGLRG